MTKEQDVTIIVKMKRRRGATAPLLYWNQLNVNSVFSTPSP